MVFRLKLVLTFLKVKIQKQKLENVSNFLKFSLIDETGKTAAPHTITKSEPNKTIFKRFTEL